MNSQAPQSPSITPGVGYLSNGGCSRYLLEAESTTGFVAWKMADGTILVSVAEQVSIRETPSLTFWSCRGYQDTSQAGKDQAEQRKLHQTTMKTNKNSPITNEGLRSQSELAVMEPQRTRAASFLGLYQDARFMKVRMGIAATRATLLAKGIHIDLTTLGRMIGFRIHIFIRREAYTALLSSIGGHHSADFTDALIALRDVLVEQERFDEPIEFFAFGRQLVAHFGQVDHDDPQPAITLTLNPEN